MKTMKSLKGKIVRVSDERASELYQEGFKYLPKSEWKVATRVVDTKSKKTYQNLKRNVLQSSKGQRLPKPKYILQLFLIISMCLKW